jgi:hypothetical protein
MQIDIDYLGPSLPRYWPAPHEGLYELINDGHERYADRLKSFLHYPCSNYASIPLDDFAAPTPCWHNGWFGPQDGVALTGMIQNIQPPLYIEVGSGNSTKFARRAVGLYSPKTRIVSIDPKPREVIDSLCDEVIRKRLEDADLSIFDRLQYGDILFVDNSHRCFMNSDVTTLFLDVLPRLPSGVMVHFHDIFLPWDYPLSWTPRYYSEQYLMACWLLSGSRLQVELPNVYIEQHADLMVILDPIWEHVSSPRRSGCSFWVSVK